MIADKVVPILLEQFETQKQVCVARLVSLPDNLFTHLVQILRHSNNHESG